eukprot:Skav213652  [mRNA]  locus=scaffold2012:360810:369855:- [translate_table: standard]
MPESTLAFTGEFNRSDGFEVLPLYMRFNFFLEPEVLECHMSELFCAIGEMAVMLLAAGKINDDELDSCLSGALRALGTLNRLELLLFWLQRFLLTVRKFHRDPSKRLFGGVYADCDRGMKKKDAKQGILVPYDKNGQPIEGDDEVSSIETPNTKRERIKGENIKLCGSITEFFIFLLTFSLAMLVNQSVATSRLSDHIRMKLNPTVHPITRITDVHTLYDYLEEVFIPAIYKNSTDIQLAESISPHLRPIDIANRLLGTVRLRQVRVDLKENCQVLPLFEQYTVSCYPNYSPGTASTTAFGPQQRFTHSADGSGIDYSGSLGSYGPDGFMQLLASNETLATQQIQELRADGFLDAATRGFFAEFNIWNSNGIPGRARYAVVNFAVEFGASGGTAQEVGVGPAMY